MTPKEKAEKLVWIYYHKIEHIISDEYSQGDWEIVKQCALIAVDEVMSALMGYDFYYWNEVKQEIDKL